MAEVVPDAVRLLARRGLQTPDFVVGDRVRFADNRKLLNTGVR